MAGLKSLNREANYVVHGIVDKLHCTDVQYNSFSNYSRLM